MVLNYYERMRAKRIEPTTHTYKLSDRHIMPRSSRSTWRLPRRCSSKCAAPAPCPRGCPLLVVDHMPRVASCTTWKVPAASCDTVLADTRHPSSSVPSTKHSSKPWSPTTKSPIPRPLSRTCAARGVEMTPYIANSLIHGLGSCPQYRESERPFYESVPESQTRAQALTRP